MRVTNYRCIDDSGQFSVGRVTCFVGKNESGKTALLQALERLKPVDETHKKYDKLTEYPRKWLSEYDDRNPNGEAQVLHTDWELEDTDIAAVEAAFGKNALRSRVVVVSKGYEQTGASFNIQIDFDGIIGRMAMSSGCTPEEQAAIKSLKTPGAVAEYVRGLSLPTTPGLAQLKQLLNTARDSNVELGVIDILYKSMPSFLYFSNYDHLDGRVSIDDLLNRQAAKTLLPGQKLFLEFLDFAKISLNDIKDAKKSEQLRARCEAASITISRQIFQYWSQNRHLKVDFVVQAGRSEDSPPFNSGFVMEARVRNELHDMTVPFSERSAGFVWFFSFLVHFSQVKKQLGNVIILLDEPGLALHAKAQTDLLRYFKEKLEPNHQVLYTTHSPFMVPAQDILAVRTVEDVIVEEYGVQQSRGTIVGDDVLSTDKDTLFPLQAALGYEITQTLFVGEHTVLVEGPSDYLYLIGFSDLLKQMGRTYLDPRWTICPTGGVDKVQAFLSLFGGNRLNVVVVIDFASGQKKKVEMLRASALLKAGRVVTFADVAERAEADVEDMLGADAYADILNLAYELKSKNKLKASDIETVNGRVLIKVEDRFRVMPESVKNFDHFQPAAYFFEHRNALAEQPAFEAGLKRFEELFKLLNAML